MMQTPKTGSPIPGVLFVLLVAISMAVVPVWAFAADADSFEMGEAEPTEIDGVFGEESLGTQDAQTQGQRVQQTTDDADDANKNSDVRTHDNIAAATNELSEDGALSAMAVGSARVTGSAHVQDVGWVNGTVSADGALMLGTEGRGLRLEAMKLKIEGEGSVPKDVLCKVHVQNEGWKDWVASGQQAGSEGKSQRLEALRIRLENSQGWHVYYRVHVQDIGWMGWASDGELAGTAGLALRMEAIEIKLVSEGQVAPQKGEAFRDAGLTVTAHVQDVGWQTPTSGKSVMLGTTGRGLRVEALTIQRPAEDIGGDIVYEAHVQNIGWQGQRRNGQVAGTSGRSLRVEAIRIHLTGELAEKYDVWYRTHVGMVGWLAWASNGDDSGTGGMSLRLEAIQIALLPKGSSAPAAPEQAASTAFLNGNENSINCSYAVTVGGSQQRAVSNGATSGTVGRSQPVQAISATVDGTIPGSIAYSAHVSNVGWVSEGSNGAWVGRANVEAIRMRLSGELSKYYSVWYRAHTANVGWLGWAHDGETAGSTEIGYAMEAYQVVIRSKGAGAPGSTANHAINATYLGGQRLSDANARQRHVVDVARSTPSLGIGLCAGWVETVFARAGVGGFGGNACDLYNNYCFSSDLRDLKVGMIVTVSTHTRTANGRLYGHSCIYVGDGLIRHSVGGSTSEMPVKEWIAFWGTTVPPKWGWIGNVALA